jgi:hypothetical protein
MIISNTDEIRRQYGAWVKATAHVYGIISLSVSKGNKFSIGKLQNMYTWVSKCMAVECFYQLLENNKNAV